MNLQAVGRTGVLAIFTLLLSGSCGYGQIVRVRVDRTVSFRSYRSFCLGGFTQKQTHIDAVLQVDIAAELAHIGLLPQQTGTCDLVVVAGQAVALMHQAWGVEGSGGSPSTVYFGPYAAGGTATEAHLTWNGWGNSDVISSSSTAPGLELDMEFIDIARKKVVFQGTVFAKIADCHRISGPKREKCQAKNDKASEKAVQKLLKRYPKT